ncbi:MAG: NUDIX hydrolase [Candidatus Microsaccharimonas sp.]
MATRRVNVRGIIVNEKGHLLVTKFRQEGKENNEREYWGTFGGGLDENESLANGLHREMIEETGIAPKIGKLLFIQQFHDGEKEQFELFFHITNFEDYSEIKLEDTSHGILELTRAEFVDPKTNFVLPEFLSTVDIQAHINNELPVHIHNELV